MPYAFFVFILVAQCILFLSHFAVYKLITYAFKPGRRTVLFIKILFGVLSISFILASLISINRYNFLTRLLYTSASAWLGILFYLLLGSLLYFIIYFSGLAGSRATLIGKLLTALALAVAIFGIFNARKIQVTEISHNLNIPEFWQGKRAVFISDVHIGQVHGKSFIEKIVHEINQLSPDIVFIGGDLFDGIDNNLEEPTKPLESLNAPLGTYFITGNHEEFDNPNKYLEILRSRGVKILNNEYENLHGLQLVGVDFKTTVGGDNLLKVLQSIGYDHNKPTILLKHTPLNLDIAQSMNINFQISGHTHRAQMFPLNFITWLVYKGHDYGLSKYENMEVYVSSGVGTWGPPVKVGSPSEIVLINFPKE